MPRDEVVGEFLFLPPFASSLQCVGLLQYFMKRQGTTQLSLANAVAATRPQLCCPSINTTTPQITKQVISQPKPLLYPPNPYT